MFSIRCTTISQKKTAGLMDIIIAFSARKSTLVREMQLYNNNLQNDISLQELYLGPSKYLL